MRSPCETLSKHGEPYKHPKYGLLRNERELCVVDLGFFKVYYTQTIGIQSERYVEQARESEVCGGLGHPDAVSIGLRKQDGEPGLMRATHNFFSTKTRFHIHHKYTLLPRQIGRLPFCQPLAEPSFEVVSLESLGYNESFSVWCVTCFKTRSRSEI